jgi:hypothetical protein
MFELRNEHKSFSDVQVLNEVNFCLENDFTTHYKEIEYWQGRRKKLFLSLVCYMEQKLWCIIALKISTQFISHNYIRIYISIFKHNGDN